MSAATKGKCHTTEFKAKLGMEAWRGVKTSNEIGQEDGVHTVVRHPPPSVLFLLGHDTTQYLIAIGLEPLLEF